MFLDTMQLFVDYFVLALKKAKNYATFFIKFGYPLEG
jgi:hypothetical protein